MKDQREIYVQIFFFITLTASKEEKNQNMLRITEMLFDMLFTE